VAYVSASRPSRRSGHYSQHVLIGGIFAASAVAFVQIDYVLNLLLRIVVLAVMVFAWLSLRDHDRRLCERCVMSMPLNPAEHAVHLRRRFATVHLAQRPLAVALYLLALIATNVMLLMNGSLPVKLVWAAAQLTMVYLVLAHSSHRMFQPWCPQCASGGTEKERIPTPLDPVGPAA
jgi:hypothetical protein